MKIVREGLFGQARHTGKRVSRDKDLDEFVRVGGVKMTRGAMSRGDQNASAITRVWHTHVLPLCECAPLLEDCR